MSFTLDAVAARAGISKGGLVYSFATKDDLVHAALEREMARFREAVRRRVGGGPTEPVELVLAHIEEALDEDDVSTQKAAFLVTALVHAPDMLEPVRRYYRVLLRLAEIGASRPLRRIPAIVSFLNPQPALSPVGGNGSSCPKADLT